MTPLEEAVSRFQKRFGSNYHNQHLLELLLEKVLWALQQPDRCRWLLEELGVDVDEVEGV